jgi:hypothetical protein
MMSTTSASSAALAGVVPRTALQAVRSTPRLAATSLAGEVLLLMLNPLAQQCASLGSTARVGLFEGIRHDECHVHAQTGELLSVEAPLPEDFQRALAMLRG